MKDLYLELARMMSKKQQLRITPSVALMGITIKTLTT